MLYDLPPARVEWVWEPSEGEGFAAAQNLSVIFAFVRTNFCAEEVSRGGLQTEWSRAELGFSSLVSHFCSLTDGGNNYCLWVTIAEER